MNGESSQTRHVSTFRMHIKPHRAPGAPGGNRPGTVDTSDGRAAAHGSADLSAPRRLEAPVFIEPLQDCCVDEGNDVTLRGVLAGSQPIKVSWLHNGEVARFGIPSFNGRETSFAVRECLPEDAGAYTCLAENGAGKTSCCAAVFVRDFETICSVQNPVSSGQTSAFKSFVGNGRSPPSPKDRLQKFKGSVCASPPGSDKLSPVSSPREVIPKKRANSESGLALHFKNPPQHFEVTVGQSARVTCFFAGRPPVASCWIRHKEQIVDGPEVWTESTDGSTTLVIAEAKPEHTGRYAVVAKDRRSSVEHTLTLAVIERPQPPASCPVVCVESAHGLVLSWSGPCYDGGSAVLGYVVEAKRESGGWSELTGQCESTSYRVSSGLQPRRSYSFRVRAYNAVGASEPGPESPEVTMEGKGVEKPKAEEEGPQQAYSSVAINSTQKVTDHYSLQERLGMGKFGLVYKLTHKETGRVNAGKFYKGRRAKEREAARKEIELMNHLHHPKLVQCLAAYDHSPEMVMVMEFIAGGELFERIVDDNFEHTESASVSYMHQILEGISFMHKQSIVHLDLKPENIVCVDTTGTSIKIIDFGLASRLYSNTPLKVMHGTPEFVAPEVINYEPVFFTTDMWSIGVICYILLSGESPFQGNNDAETLALVTAAEWEFDESFEEITDQAKHFISSLLHKDTRRRMSSEEALAHPWMAFEPGDEATSRSLSKDRLKRFLARQKWKKAGKALLALKRMALLSRAESSASGSPTSPRADSPLSPEAKHALQSLELKMQGPPHFTQSLADQTVGRGSRARLSCHLTGYPDPEVVWLCGDEPVEESPTAQIEYEEDGCCTLVLARVGPEDGNVYTCRAINDHGEASCSAKLVVQR